MPEHGRQGADDQDELKAEIVKALQSRRSRRRPGELPRPIPAAALARRFGIRPPRLAQLAPARRRHPHKAHRTDGVPVLSVGRGYYLGTEPEDYAAAEDFARRNGLSDLALAATFKHHPERADSRGQLGLFA